MPIPVHFMVYALGIGAALTLAVYTYFAHDDRQENRNRQAHQYERRLPPPPQDPRPLKPTPKKPRQRYTSGEFCLSCSLVLNDDDRRTLNCGHAFHLECIHKFKEYTCPNCGYQF